MKADVTKIDKPDDHHSGGWEARVRAENKPRAKRRSLLEQALPGDLVIAVGDGKIRAIERVDNEGYGGEAIKERWTDQGLVDGATVEVWEVRAGGYYRKRKAGR